MKITHLSNSFIVIEINGIKICCDPWVGKANYGGWHSFPEFDKNGLMNYLNDVDIVYISHLHDDHLDTDFLIESKLFEKGFIIKNFKFKTLLNKLKFIGVQNISELEPFEIFLWKGVHFSILPQMSTNSDDLDEDVEYDLDTSLIVSHGKNVFFNQVDNPYSTSDYLKLKNWIETNYGKITIAALMAGAASEYPHLFLNINRISEKKVIVENSLKRLVEKLNILNPDYYFPAGGTYIIPGKFNVLNSLIAQPTIFEIQEVLKTSDIRTKFLFLEGGNSVEFKSDNNESIVLSNVVSPESIDKIFSIDNHKYDSYDYENEINDLSFDKVTSLFERAKRNWEDMILKLNIDVEQDVFFILYRDLELNNDGNSISSNSIGELEIKSNLIKSKGRLVIHIDLRAFYLCLIRKKVWNGTIGALCLFERVPNIFYPNVTFSLNYLVVNDFNK